MHKKYLYIISLMLLIIPFALYAKEGQGVVLGESVKEIDVLRFGSDVVINENISRDIIAGAGTITINEPVAKDALLFGGTIIINKKIEKDLRVFGGNITVLEEIGGDILSVGADININAQVNGDIRVAGGEVLISSNVLGNVAIAGGKVIFDKDSVIEGSVVVYAGEIELNGIIKGNVKTSSGKLVVNNEILGDVEATLSDSKNLELGSNALISGSLTYNSQVQNNDINEDSVAGEIIFQQKDVAPVESQKNSFIWFFKLISLFGMMVVGLVLVGIAPKSIRNTIESSIKNPAKDLLWGLVILVASPVLVVFLMLTIIGFPLALILALIYGISLYIAKVFVGIVLGTYIFGAIKGRKKTQEISLLWIMVLGVVVLWLISGIPVLGLFIQVIALIWGLGLIVKIKRQGIKKIEHQGIIESITKDN